MLRITVFIFASLICSCNTSSNKTIEIYQPINKLSSADSAAKEIRLKLKFNSFDTTVDVLFWDTKDSISGLQQKNYEGFFSKQAILTPAILNKIFDYYKDAYPNFKTGWKLNGNITDEELEKHLPKPTTPENLIKYITPAVIYIQNKKDCKPGTIGIEFDCTWDVEYGLGVKIEDWKVTEAGVAEASYFFSGDNP